MSASAEALIQAEADRLLAMPKRSTEQRLFRYPDMGTHLAIPLCSLDERERFSLDIGRSYVRLTKATYQTRARGNVILARLDLGGAPHTNPDGVVLPCPHLHVYREDYGDKWAQSLPEDVFKNVGDRQQTFLDFLDYCRVVEKPTMEWGLLA